MVRLDGTLTTDEMSLVTYLSLHGITPVMFKKGARVHWVLQENEVDEFVEELVSDFRSGAARVEPNRFAREWSDVRRRMFSFLDHQAVSAESA